MDALMYKIFARVLSTITTLARDRGKDITRCHRISDIDQLTFGPAFDASLGIEPMATGTIQNSLVFDGDPKLLVMFIIQADNKASLGVELVSNVMALIVNAKFREVILVTAFQKPAPRAKEVLESYQKMMNLRLMYFEDLSFPLVQHSLGIQQCRLYRDGEEYAKREGLVLDNMPGLSIEDPLCAYYGAQVGDIIEGYSIGASHSYEYVSYCVREVISAKP